MNSKRIKNYPLFFLSGALFIILIGLFALSPAVVSELSLYFDRYNTVESILGSNEQLLPEGVEKGFISRVVDGDTAVLQDGRTIRILYIDTPETVKPNSPIECYGPEASSFSKKVLERKPVLLRYDKQKLDRYGRHLMIVYFDGVDTNDIERSFNAIMIREGYATVSIYSPNNQFENELKKIENDAKANNKGLWKDCVNKN